MCDWFIGGPPSNLTCKEVREVGLGEERGWNCNAGATGSTPEGKSVVLPEESGMIAGQPKVTNV